MISLCHASSKNQLYCHSSCFNSLKFPFKYSNELLTYTRHFCATPFPHGFFELLLIEYTEQYTNAIQQNNVIRDSVSYSGAGAVLYSNLFLCPSFFNCFHSSLQKYHLLQIGAYRSYLVQLALAILVLQHCLQQQSQQSLMTQQKEWVWILLTLQSQI